AADPKAKDIGPVLVVEVGRVDRLPGCFGRRLGDLLLILVDDESVSHHRLVGSLVAHRYTEHQRTLEPATMLVGCLEIKIGGTAQFGMAIHHRDMTGTGIDPDIEGIFAAGRSSRKSELFRPPRVVVLEPEIR